MKIWFDTEFIEDGKTIDLISIGMVREDGAVYYAENATRSSRNPGASRSASRTGAKAAWYWDDNASRRSVRNCLDQETAKKQAQEFARSVANTGTTSAG